MRANNDCLLCLRNEPGMAQTGLVHFVVSVQLRTSARTTSSNVLEWCVSSIVIDQHQHYSVILSQPLPKKLLHYCHRTIIYSFH